MAIPKETSYPKQFCLLGLKLHNKERWTSSELRTEPYQVGRDLDYLNGRGSCLSSCSWLVMLEFIASSAQFDPNLTHNSCSARLRFVDLPGKLGEADLLGHADLCWEGEEGLNLKNGRFSWGWYPPGPVDPAQVPEPPCSSWRGRRFPTSPRPWPSTSSPSSPPSLYWIVS